MSEIDAEALDFVRRLVSSGTEVRFLKIASFNKEDASLPVPLFMINMNRYATVKCHSNFLH